VKDFSLGSIWTCERVKLLVVEGEPKFMISQTLELTVFALETKQVVFIEPNGNKQPVAKKLIKRFKKSEDGCYVLIQSKTTDPDTSETENLVARYIRFRPATP
jgi:hypothetical protein